MSLFQAEPFEAIRRGFRDFTGGGLGPWILLAAVVLAAAVVVARVALARRRDPNRRLFRRLADAADLTSAERRFLRRAAERAGGPGGEAAIFFRRSLFEGAVPGSGADRRIVEGLRRKLYSP